MKEIKYTPESFTDKEKEILLNYFSNIDLPVYVLFNLPEVVKGALFARYSRSSKSLRRLFLDEFIDKSDDHLLESNIFNDADRGTKKASSLYQRVFTEYGDDSVAQLGSVHLACEQSSNILTKVLEWGRIASYLEQSTRYIYYDQFLGGRYRYYIPDEIIGSESESEYVKVMDFLFKEYSDLIKKLSAHYEISLPKKEDISDISWKSSIRAKVCDDLRGLLPASVLSNMGIFASGQAFEMLLIRMAVHPLEEVRQYREMMIKELRKVIPDFLRRVDIPERGVKWSQYLKHISDDMVKFSIQKDNQNALSKVEVELIEWDKDAEKKVAAAALYSISNTSEQNIREYINQLSKDKVEEIIHTYVGNRLNRRHKPGRAFESTYYKFDLSCNYGVFRDLQRHRMLTIEWQKLSTHHGYDTPNILEKLGLSERWHNAMAIANQLYNKLSINFGTDVAQYAVPFAYRVRFYIQMNAREAFHFLELRTQQGGDPSYRRICQEMHRQILERANHKEIANSMNFVDYNDYELGRLEGEKTAEKKRKQK